MILNFEEMLIKDKANTVPGIAYPTPARFAISLSNKVLFERQANESTKENSIAINAVIRPRLRVLNAKASNSTEKPFWI